MTTGALLIMLSTWIIVIFFTVKFFLKILHSPHLHNPAEEAFEDQLEE
jgi:hypothetical protein